MWGYASVKQLLLVMWQTYKDHLEACKIFLAIVGDHRSIQFIVFGRSRIVSQTLSSK